MTRKGVLTVQRKAIFDIVSTATDHPTAADVIERLKERGCQYAYATVYNSLRYLSDEGMIRELKLEGDASRYDARTEEHQHIVCITCGRVDEVFTEAPQQWLSCVAEETGYELHEQQHLFKGVCVSCRDTKKQTH